MMNDPVIQGSVSTINAILGGVPWNVEPPEVEDQAQLLPVDEKAVRFVRECRDDMSHSWPHFILAHTSWIWRGWSSFEIVWKVRGGDTDDPTTRSKYNDGRVAPRKQPAGVERDRRNHIAIFDQISAGSGQPASKQFARIERVGVFKLQYHIAHHA